MWSNKLFPMYSNFSMSLPVQNTQTTEISIKVWRNLTTATPTQLHATLIFYSGHHQWFFASMETNGAWQTVVRSWKNTPSQNMNQWWGFIKIITGSFLSSAIRCAEPCNKKNSQLVLIIWHQDYDVLICAS